MRRILIFIICLLAFTVANAAEDGVYFHAHVDLSNKASLQRGARIFVNYCQGCHTAKYMRYNRLGKDLGITTDVLKKNLMFGTKKPGKTMTNSMSKSEGIQFFNVAPPDLSVIARAKGPDWLYSYFMTFYLDPSRPTGVNNMTFKNVGMPDVLWKLQGWQKAVMKKGTPPGAQKEIDHLEMVTPGKLTPKEYAGTVNDLVNFLVYVGEPAKLKRYSVGGWVMVYLFVLLVVAYLLKKEYWRDVH